jgi:hypothetical protein
MKKDFSNILKGRLQVGDLVLYKLHGNAAVAELADALA